METEVLGVIIPWPLSWAPQGWKFCDGSTLQVAQNQALFSLIGKKFGGDGVTTFNLPNLCGCVPIGAGNFQNTSISYNVGDKGGISQTTLLSDNLPIHTHAATVNSTNTCTINANLTVAATSTFGNVAQPDTSSYFGRVPNSGRTAVTAIYNNAAVTRDVQLPGGKVSINNTNVSLTATIGNTGGGAPVNNMQPYLVLNYIICIAGYYPPRP